MAAPEVRPLRLTLEERTVVPVTLLLCEEELRACWPEPEEEEVLPEEVTFLVLWLLLERAVEELLTVEPLLVVELLLLWEERTVVPLCCLAAELLPELLPELLTELPLEREVLVLPLEREVPEVVVLPEERRLSCCWTAPLLRVVELLLEERCCWTALPEELLLEELLPEERVTVLPLERELLELLLPEEREVLVLPLEEREVLLPPEERD